MNIPPSLPENSRRALSVLRSKDAYGYGLMQALGLQDGKGLAEALEPLTSNNLVRFAGSPYTDDGLQTALYYVPPGSQAYADVLLAFQPVRLSAEAPAGNTLTQESRLALAALRRKVAGGYELLQATGAKDAAGLAKALSPLVERGLVHYSGTPFTDDGLCNAYYSIPPSKQGEADLLLRLQRPKLGGLKP